MKKECSLKVIQALASRDTYPNWQIADGHDAMVFFLKIIITDLSAYRWSVHFDRIHIVVRTLATKAWTQTY